MQNTVQSTDHLFGFDGSDRKRVLNAGSGPRGFAPVHSAFSEQLWTEVRLDLDPQARPDLVASITDMKAVVRDASFDSVWSSHSIEHLNDHEVLPAMREFRRALKADGFTILCCPNLEAIARLVISGDVEDVAYQSAAGPITPLDMLYGHRASIASGRYHMAHKTGFTVDRLGRTAIDAGFSEARVVEGLNFDLWAILSMPETELQFVASLFEGTNLEPLFDLP